MSGWQKIGVLASFLWLIGLPIYLMTDRTGGQVSFTIGAGRWNIILPSK